MQLLINDLLRFSRETTSNEDFTDVDLNDLIHDVMADMEIDIEKTGALINISELPTVWAIPSQMRQLFQNLISNAIKFRRRDIVPIIDITTVSFRKDMFRIIVQDNGIGFDSKYADEIFVVFKRLHSYHEFEGTGVGLSICKKIIERHHGEIRAESKPGSGSRFIVDLPVVEKKTNLPDLHMEEMVHSTPSSVHGQSSV
jgi:light-regulated signal transduction histidine kinase (bacteriophytochrome)